MVLNTATGVVVADLYGDKVADIRFKIAGPGLAGITEAGFIL